MFKSVIDRASCFIRGIYDFELSFSYVKNLRTGASGGDKSMVYRKHHTIKGVSPVGMWVSDVELGTSQYGSTSDKKIPVNITTPGEIYKVALVEDYLEEKKDGTTVKRMRFIMVSAVFSEAEDDIIISVEISIV